MKTFFLMAFFAALSFFSHASNSNQLVTPASVLEVLDERPFDITVKSGNHTIRIKGTYTYNHPHIKIKAVITITGPNGTTEYEFNYSGEVKAGYGPHKNPYDPPKVDRELTTVVALIMSNTNLEEQKDIKK